MSKWGSSNLRSLSSADISTLLSKDAEIRGSIKTQGSIRIDGAVVGDVVSAKTVTVGAGGSVEGNVVAEEIIVSGRVKGTLTAKQKISLEATAQLEGDIHATRLTISEGAVFRGQSSMGAPQTPRVVVSNGQSKIGELPKPAERAAVGG
ncbi:polymer-forming cytoskeletal protein [candidate division KSB1 bacterium]|nr:polymer-forming cytoskeletal protein [candidate division KSB1 bacterium]